MSMTKRTSRKILNPLSPVKNSNENDINDDFYKNIFEDISDFSKKSKDDVLSNFKDFEVLKNLYKIIRLKIKDKINENINLLEKNSNIPKENTKTIEKQDESKLKDSEKDMKYILIKLEGERKKINDFKTMFSDIKKNNMELNLRTKKLKDYLILEAELTDVFLNYSNSFYQKIESDIDKLVCDSDGLKSLMDFIIRDKISN